MKIAILGGTGSIGEGFALRWAGKHEILVCSREIDKAVNAAEEYTNILLYRGMQCCGITGCGNEKAIEEADVIVLSVPYKGVISLLNKLMPLFKDQIVISLVVPM
ncbi:MAG: NAD(P)-binding domain-containing protein, partial [Candidatus Methanoperedens sp.]|nr:NAD(P)-binding domain-containing protein [Candidatus Methanoperedens sp.]